MTAPRRLARVASALAATCLLVTQSGVAQDAAESPATRIYIGKADGSDMKRLAKLDEYRTQGSPTWSQDGKLIAFDAWKPQDGEDLQDAKIILVGADGGNPRVLGDGAMPSFSPQAKRIAFSRYAPNRGVWVMSSQGPENGIVLLDEDGWGADWSPDGRKIAYTSYGQSGANIAVVDVIEGTRTLLFDDNGSPYSQIYWNFTWSPDGKQIAFLGTKGQHKEVAIIDTRGAEHGLVTRLKKTINASLAWRPDGKRLLFSMSHPERKLLQLYDLDPNTDDPPQLLPGQNPKWRNGNMAYSPDGKKLAVSILPDTPQKTAANQAKEAKNEPRSGKKEQDPDEEEQKAGTQKQESGKQAKTTKKSVPVTKIFGMDVDSRDVFELASFPDYPIINSPEISPDGKWVAVDGWKAGETLRDARLLMVNLENGKKVDLGTGCMPTWSADGQWIAYCKYAPEHGVYISARDGDDEKLIDRDGWGIQWAPNGLKAAYTRDGQFVIYDFIADTRKEISTAQDWPYSFIYWNPTWSSDSRKICFLGRRGDGRSEIGILDLSGDAPRFRVHGDAAQYQPDIAWKPDGSRIALVRKPTPGQRGQIYVFDPSKRDPPQRLADQPADHATGGMCWSRDGETLIFLSRR